MRLRELVTDKRGQAEAVQVQVTLIISLLIAIIVIYQLFISGVGPTIYISLDENGNPTNAPDNVDNTTTSVTPNPDYDASALTAWNNTRNLAWAGIGLMAVAIIVLAAAVILRIVRGGLGGQV